jgi:two-component system NarL family sensor kinase
MSGRAGASARMERLAHPGGVLAVIRLAAIPVFFAAERLVEHPAANGGPFAPLLVAAAVYAGAALVAELRGRPLGPPSVLTGADVLLIAGLVATSGGPFSQLRYAFFLLPVGAALLLRPRLTAAASAAAVALYALIALTYPDPERVRMDAVGFEFTQGLFLVWMGAAATLLSLLLTRSARRVADLAASRGRLVAQALDAEDRARRRLAEALHDDALQNLLAARQLLGSGNGAELPLVAEGLDRSVVQIREAVFDLHPYLLEQAGLRAALQAVAERAGQRGGFEAAVDVDPGAEGVHDALVFSIARELLANASKHAHAKRVHVSVRRREDAVELTVADDGRGLDLARVRQAPLRGSIGLASSAERAEAIGGAFELGAPPSGRGTRVRVSLPAPVPAAIA